MGHEVVVDLEGVTFMDCSGVRPLLEASAAMGPASAPGAAAVAPGPSS